MNVHILAAKSDETLARPCKFHTQSLMIAPMNLGVIRFQRSASFLVSCHPMLALTCLGAIECALAFGAPFRRMLDSARVTLNVSAKFDVQIADALRSLLDGRHAVVRRQRRAAYSYTSPIL
jgi:hypothetical protein